MNSNRGCGPYLQDETVSLFWLIFAFAIFTILSPQIIVEGGSNPYACKYQGNPEFKLVEVQGSHHVHLNQPDEVMVDCR